MRSQVGATIKWSQLVARVVASITVLLSAACSSNGASSVSDQASTSYPALVRSEFLTNCAATSGGKRSACECALELLEAKLTLEEFAALDATVAATGTVPPAIQEIFLSCG